MHRRNGRELEAALLEQVAAMAGAAASEIWNVAFVPIPVGDFTCYALDANGEWQSDAIPDIPKGGQIGLKAVHPMPGWSPLAKTRMLFTFTSPTGKQTQVEKKSSNPIVIDGSVTETAQITANEVGQWHCQVEYWEGSGYDIWGPFPIANVFDGDDDDGGGGLNLTDTQKALLIAAGVGVAAIALMKKE
jgi:hypothetical protein